MTIYKCRSPSEKDWSEYEADTPEIAAMVYAEEYCLKVGDIVSVWSIGKFNVHYIYLEPIYEMVQITGRRHPNG